MQHVQQKLDALFADISRFRGHPIPADPFIDAVEEIRAMVRGCAAHADVDEPWIAVPRAMRKTGLSPSYFRAKLKMLGGQSRLQNWREAGRAKQEESGDWFISSSIKLPVKAERMGATGATPATDEELAGDDLDCVIQRMNFL